MLKNKQNFQNVAFKPLSSLTNSSSNNRTLWPLSLLCDGGREALKKPNNGLQIPPTESRVHFQFGDEANTNIKVRCAHV